MRGVNLDRDERKNQTRLGGKVTTHERKKTVGKNDKRKVGLP